jgi:hypothetical protein
MPVTLQSWPDEAHDEQSNPHVATTLHITQLLQDIILAQLLWRKRLFIPV